MNKEINLDKILHYFTETGQGWVMEVFIIVLLALVANLVVRKLFDRLEVQLEKTKNPWDDALLASARKPLGHFIWLIGITWAIEVIQVASPATIFEAVGSIRDILVVVLLTMFLIRFIKLTEANLVSKSFNHDPVDETTAAAIGKLLRAAVLITSALVMLQTFGYSISGVLAFGGVGGIAIGFAAKDLLSNFFGGLMIYLDRPFKVGDWIRSPDQDIEGTVEYIGWRTTRIRTFSQRPLYIPNSTFASISVENPSRMLNRRIYETIGVRYEDADKLATIVEQVEAMLREHPAIDLNKTLMVNFNAFAPSSLDFFIYTFTKTTDWAKYHAIKQDVLLRIHTIIADLGGEMAFPTSTVHLVQETPIGGADT